MFSWLSPQGLLLLAEAAPSPRADATQRPVPLLLLLLLLLASPLPQLLKAPSLRAVRLVLLLLAPHALRLLVVLR